MVTKSRIYGGGEKGMRVKKEIVERQIEVSFDDGPFSWTARTIRIGSDGVPVFSTSFTRLNIEQLKEVVKMMEAVKDVS